ncbi:MAG TPA: hypothetical protein VFA15_02595, partial [Nitrososphaera sp.]|nr:hypothetical protein [Nitrososphaera sp.]
MKLFGDRKKTGEGKQGESSVPLAGTAEDHSSAPVSNQSHPDAVEDSAGGKEPRSRWSFGKKSGSKSEPAEDIPAIEASQSSPPAADFSPQALGK